MKKFLLSALFLGWLGAEILEVSADRFRGNEKDGISVVEGNVDIKKGEDTLKAKKVTIYTNDKRKLEKIIAEGEVRFHVVTTDGRRMQGSSGILTYDAITGEYRLQKSAQVEEEGKENIIRGEEIVLNNKTGYVNVVGGSNKPAKLIFNLQDAKKDVK